MSSIVRVSQPARVDFEVKEGTTFKVDVDLYNDSDGSNHDVSVYTTISLVAKLDKNSSTESFSMAIAAGITVPGSPNNRLEFSDDLDSSESAVYYYDVLGTKATGEIFPLMEGIIKIKDTVQ